MFEIRDAEEGGFYARALGHAIFTEAETWEDLRANLLQSVSLHFEDAAVRPSATRSNALRQRRTDSSRSRMKLPRDISSDRLIRALARLDWNSPHRSSGRKPVSFAIFASAAGPISSLS